MCMQIGRQVGCVHVYILHCVLIYGRYTGNWPGPSRRESWVRLAAGPPGMYSCRSLLLVFRLVWSILTVYIIQSAGAFINAPEFIRRVSVVVYNILLASLLGATLYTVIQVVLCRRLYRTTWVVQCTQEGRTGFNEPAQSAAEMCSLEVPPRSQCWRIQLSAWCGSDAGKRRGIGF